MSNTYDFIVFGPDADRGECYHQGTEVEYESMVSRLACDTRVEMQERRSGRVIRNEYGQVEC